MGAILGGCCPPSSSTLPGFRQCAKQPYATPSPSRHFGLCLRAGGHPRCPKSSRGHHIPEENQPQFCVSANETVPPHHNLRFTAHLCKAPQAASDGLQNPLSPSH